MKQTITITVLLYFLTLTSCEDHVEKKKLALITIENEEVLVEKYIISELTSLHQFIDLTDKRRNKVERILEANDGTVDSTFIRQDTLYLRLNTKEPTIYDLASIKFGYKIILLDPKSN
jgi:hypothetical protein